MTFKEEEREDIRWRLREEILLSEVEREVLAKLHEMVHLQEASASQYVDQTTFDHHHNAANKQYHSYAKLMYPYGTDAKTLDQKTVDELVTRWKEVYGDPDSPKVKRAIEAMTRLANGQSS